MPLTAIKEEFNQVAADGVVTNHELDRFIALVNTHQDAIERERIEGHERERKVITSAIQVIFGITMSQFGLIAVLLQTAGVNLVEHWWVFLSFSFTFVQTIAALKVKGWLRDIPIQFSHVGDILKSLFAKTGKPIPDVPDVVDNIPDITSTNTSPLLSTGTVNSTGGDTSGEQPTPTPANP